MAKKQSSSALTTFDGTKPNGQVAVISLKGTAAYRDWLAAESKRTHIPAASLVRIGLALWAEKNNAKKPPDK